MVNCLERSAFLHATQLMPLPLTVSCFSKIQIGFTFLVPAHPGSPEKRAAERVCVCAVVPCGEKVTIIKIKLYVDVTPVGNASDQTHSRTHARTHGRTTR